MAVFAPAAASAGETPYRIGFDILTSAENPEIRADTLHLRYSGPIEFPMAENLAGILDERAGRFSRVTLDLDSGGGELTHMEKVIAVLAARRHGFAVETLVRNGKRCLSACIPVYMQGEARLAGNASVWMFHGACPLFSSVPAAPATERYLATLREAGVAAAFLNFLVENCYVTKSGQFWLSGYELVHVHNSGIPTELLSPWREIVPEEPPFETDIKPR